MMELKVMKRVTASIIVLASFATAGYAFAQDTQKPEAAQTTTAAPKDANHFKREPIDLEQFSKMTDLKAADTNGDGTLSREELEAYSLKEIVRRAADRMERSLDINGDGKVTLEEIQKQKTKEFAAMDRNDDGKLDFKEMRAPHHGSKRGHAGGHGFHQNKTHQQK
jgi:hypothetical protein